MFLLMREALELARHEATGWRRYVLATYYILTWRFTLTVAGAGVALIGLGAVFESILSPLGFGGGIVPTVAGFMGIWGASLVLIGLVSYLMFFASRKYGELATSN